MKTQRSLRLSRLGLSAAMLATVLMPAAAYAVTASTSNVQIQATVASVISINTPASVAVSLTPTAAGPVSIGSHTVTVSTNNTTGYKLYVKDADSTLTMANGGNSINPASGTVGTPAPLSTINTYGYAVAGAPFAATYTVANDAAYDSSKTFAGITASDAQIRNTTTTASNENTVVYWGVRGDTSLPNGAYTNSVVYTATTNP